MKEIKEYVIINPKTGVKGIIEAEMLKIHSSGKLIEFWCRGEIIATTSSKYEITIREHYYPNRIS